MIEILKGVPLPPKRQKQIEVYVNITSEPKQTVVKQFPSIIPRLKDGSLKWRVSINRWRNGDKVF